MTLRGILLSKFCCINEGDRHASCITSGESGQRIDKNRTNRTGLLPAVAWTYSFECWTCLPIRCVSFFFFRQFVRYLGNDYLPSRPTRCTESRLYVSTYGDLESLDRRLCRVPLFLNVFHYSLDYSSFRFSSQGVTFPLRTQINRRAATLIPHVKDTNDYYVTQWH